MPTSWVPRRNTTGCPRHGRPRRPALTCWSCTELRPGHRASWVDSDEAEGLSTLALLRLVSAAVDIPLVAAGGLTDGPGIARARGIPAGELSDGTDSRGGPRARRRGWVQPLGRPDVSACDSRPGGRPGGVAGHRDPKGPDRSREPPRPELTNLGPRTRPHASPQLIAPTHRWRVNPSVHPQANNTTPRPNPPVPVTLLYSAYEGRRGI
jgi:hypothetical protein